MHNSTLFPLSNTTLYIIGFTTLGLATTIALSVILGILGSVILPYISQFWSSPLSTLDRETSTQMIMDEARTRLATYRADNDRLRRMIHQENQGNNLL